MLVSAKGPSAAEVSAALTDRLESLLAQLLPQGERWGRGEFVALNPMRPDRNLGSFRIRLVGDKRGRWRDFAIDVGGDPLDLVAYLGSLDLKDARKWALEWLGRVPSTPPTLREGSRKEAAQAIVDTEGRAAAIWNEARPILDSPADEYLRGRGIDIRALPRVPSCVRYHPRVWQRETGRTHPCMVAWILRRDRRAAIHRTWLERRNFKWIKLSGVEDAKQSLGPVQGGFVPLYRGLDGRRWNDCRTDDTIGVTDGIEDGLTIALAQPLWRMACAVNVGNFAHIELPPGNVVLFRDRETKPEAVRQAEKAYGRAVARFREQGRTVWFWDPPAGAAKDPNELLTTGAA